MKVFATEDTEVTEKSNAVADRLFGLLSVFSVPSVAQGFSAMNIPAVFPGGRS